MSWSRMKKKTSIAFSAVAAALFGVIATIESKNAPSAKPISENASPQLEARAAKWPSEIRIGYQKSEFFLFLKLNHKLDEDLAKHGTKVVWYEFTSGPPLLQALNSGSLDLGEVGGAPAVFAQAAPGSQVAYVAYEPEVYRGILVPKQSNLNTLADLKGKKVAYAKGSSANFLVLAALNKGHLGLSDIQSVYLQPTAAREAFDRGDVDAWAIWDPYLAAAQLQDGAKVLVSGSQLPKQYGFIVGRMTYVKQYSSAVKTVISDLNAVSTYVKTHQAIAAQELAQATGIDASVWKLTLSRRGYGVFPMNQEVVRAQQAIADSFYQGGLLQNKVDVSQAVVNY